MHTGTGFPTERIGFIRGCRYSKIIYGDGGKPKRYRLALGKTALELPPVIEREVPARRPATSDPYLCRLLHGLVIDENRARAVEAAVFQYIAKRRACNTGRAIVKGVPDTRRGKGVWIPAQVQVAVVFDVQRVVGTQKNQLVPHRIALPIKQAELERARKVRARRAGAHSIFKNAPLEGNADG